MSPLQNNGEIDYMHTYDFNELSDITYSVSNYIRMPTFKLTTLRKYVSYNAYESTHVKSFPESFAYITFLTCT